jgi:hypothetical protein
MLDMGNEEWTLTEGVNILPDAEEKYYIPKPAQLL